MLKYRKGFSTVFHRKGYFIIFHKYRQEYFTIYHTYRMKYSTIYHTYIKEHSTIYHTFRKEYVTIYISQIQKVMYGSNTPDILLNTPHVHKGILNNIPPIYIHTSTCEDK